MYILGFVILFGIGFKAYQYLFGKNNSSIQPANQRKEWSLEEDISEIIENKLFLSGAGPVTQPKLLEKFGITAVITISRNKKELPDSIKYKWIEIHDSSNSNLKPKFTEIYNFIEENQTGATLVHCEAGMSRSASGVIGYLMKSKNISLKDSYQYLKKKRSIIQPNFGFIKQLMEYEKDLGQHESKYFFAEYIYELYHVRDIFAGVTVEQIYEALNSTDSVDEALLLVSSGETNK